VPLLFSIGVLYGSVWVVTTLRNLLAAPQGTLSRGDRRIITAAYALVTVGVLPLYLSTTRRSIATRARRTSSWSSGAIPPWTSWARR